MSNYYVYKHTSPSGKVYIGISCQEPNRRWENGRAYTFNPHFTNAIKKYGWDCFDHEIIESKLTREEANNLEIYYIEQYNSANRLFGYNASLGGGVHSEATRNNISKGVSLAWQDKEKKSKWIKAFKEAGNRSEHRKKISRIARERYKDPKEREKISNALKGFYQNANNRERMSEIAKERWQNPKTRELYINSVKKQWKDPKKQPVKPRKVYCVELDKTFDSAREASEATGANAISIRQICNKKEKPKTSGGYHWEWETK